MAVFQLSSYFPKNGEGINSYVLRCFSSKKKKLFALGWLFFLRRNKKSVHSNNSESKCPYITHVKQCFEINVILLKKLRPIIFSRIIPTPISKIWAKCNHCKNPFAGLGRDHNKIVLRGIPQLFIFFSDNI